MLVYLYCTRCCICTKLILNKFILVNLNFKKYMSRTQALMSAPPYTYAGLGTKLEVNLIFLKSTQIDLEHSHVPHRYKMCQEYIEDLNHLLSIAKHPKSISLLQTAIEQQRSLLREQTVALEVPKAEGTGPSNHEPRIYSTRITQYGNT